MQQIEISFLSETCETFFFDMFRELLLGWEKFRRVLLTKILPVGLTKITAKRM